MTNGTRIDFASPMSAIPMKVTAIKPKPSTWIVLRPQRSMPYIESR